jgi:hypothetical protein
MPVSRVTPLNQVQRVSELQIVDTIVLQPHTWYTCPTGKRARVIGVVVCKNTGAAANARFRVAGEIYATWVATGGTIEPSLIVDLFPGVIIPFEVILEAGETIQTTQSTGTNAEFFIDAKVLELPA